MVLTRREKEQRILELLEQGHNTREVAQETHTSFSYIGAVRRKAAKEKEIEEEQVQKASLSTQAYKLFLEGKNPVQVSIALNIREPEVDQYFKEYFKLEKLENLYQMYREIIDDIETFVKLYKLMKDADMKPEQTVKLLSFANNGLVSLHFEYNALKTEVEYLKGQKEELSNALENIKKNLVYYTSLCQKKIAEMEQLSRQIKRQENLARNFENNNEEYLKMKKFVEEKIRSILSAGKPLLEHAVLSVIESIKRDPEKYSPLIDSKIVNSASHNYEQYHSNEYDEACKTILIQEADKVYSNI